MSEVRSGYEALDELARLAQAGDSHALEALLRECYSRIHRWALVRTGDPDDADDVTQSVLVVLHRRLHQWTGRSRFTTWLYRVTMNAAGSWRRRAAARLRLAGRVARELETSGEPAGAECEAERQSMVQLVRRFFQGLPPVQRQVFDLADLQGLGQQEVADMLGMKAVTVRAHLFRARRAIRARILALDPAAGEERS
ncbi:MAG TPA: RNA polymerase sigma factor [Gemmatimonadales bacterium]|nr:RNA polymerase sigma factor [Gemmatimonadales bacterium]